MPAMSGAVGRMECRNSDNRKPPPASCIEIYPALAEMGAELIKMPAFVCVFAYGTGVFVLKCGQK